MNARPLTALLLLGTTFGLLGCSRPEPAAPTATTRSDGGTASATTTASDGGDSLP